MKIIREKFENQAERWFYEKGNKVIFHREDGPAVIDYNMKIFAWFYHGNFLSFENWCEKTKKTDEEIVQLKLMYSTDIYV